ncbi:hypothetical protein DXG01_004454 [Tephrocybe rancida]|nr:hypothetical protein DXG01_004454 [Tephrocybe rancida]
MFVYKSATGFDPADPWKGLLRSTLLVMAFKHVFIAPSSIDDTDVDAASKGGNTEIHGMKSITTTSIIYVATQVQFALLSTSFWSHTDQVTNSETFYMSLFDMLEDPENAIRVQELLEWWDSKIFPHLRPDVVMVFVIGSLFERIQQLNVQEALAKVVAGAGSDA